MEQKVSCTKEREAEFSADLIGNDRKIVRNSADSQPSILHESPGQQDEAERAETQLMLVRNNSTSLMTLDGTPATKVEAYSLKKTMCHKKKTGK